MLTAPQHVRQLYALVSETLRYASVLEKLLDRAALLQAEKKLTPQLAKVQPSAGSLGRGNMSRSRAVPDSQNPRAAVSRSRGGLGRRDRAQLVPSSQVLVYDLLFGKGLKCGGRWKALTRRHRARLEAELARMKVRRKVSRNEDLLAPEKAVSAASE